MQSISQSGLPKGVEFEEIRTLEQIESIRPVWEKMQAEESCPVINADIDRYLSVLRGYENSSSPLILCLKQNGQPIAMVIGRIEQHTIPIRIGYKTIFNPMFKYFSVVYGGVLGQPNEQVSSMLIQGLIRIMRQGKMDCIGFNHLRIGSPFYRQIRRISSFLCRNHFLVIDPHWITEVPESVEEFQGDLSQKRRHELKRLTKKLERDTGFHLKIKEFYEENQVDTFLNIAEKMSSNSYKLALNAGVKNEPVTRNCIHKDVQLGRWHGFVMFIGDEPCAYESGTIFNKIFFVETIGYEYKWASYSPGKLLLVKIFEYFCGKKEVNSVDFGFGDAMYKQRFCNKSWPEAKATYIFAPRPYPLLVNSLIVLNGALTLCLTWVVKKIGLYAWIKRVWRRKLTEGRE